MSADVRITAEPIDNGRCKFLVSEPLHAGGVRRFASPDEARGSPLAEAIFAIPGADVSEVVVSGNLVTVGKRSPAPWPVVGKAVVTLRQGIEAMLHQHVPEVKGIVDITDHTAGSNPYFAAAKK